MKMKIALLAFLVTVAVPLCLGIPLAQESEADLIKEEQRGHETKPQGVQSLGRTAPLRHRRRAMNHPQLNEAVQLKGQPLDNRFMFKRNAMGSMRGGGRYADFMTPWNDRQGEMMRLRNIGKHRGYYAKSPGVYDSYMNQWISSYANGPIDRRSHTIQFGPQLRYGYPLSKSHPQRSGMTPYSGYYQDFNVRGNTK